MKDGYLRATAGDGGGVASPYAAELVILPLDEIFYRCRQEILDVVALTDLSPVNVLYQALKFARGADYGMVLQQARQLLIDSDRLLRGAGDDPRRDLHRVVDAMSGIHGAIHTTFQAIYHHAYNFIEPVRVIGDSGLVVRMVA